MSWLAKPLCLSGLRARIQRTRSKSSLVSRSTDCTAAELRMWSASSVPVLPVRGSGRYDDVAACR